MKKIIMSISTLILAFSVFMLIGCDQSESLSYASIEINPAVDMVLDRGNRVQTVTAMNQDGEMLLLGLHLENKKVETAIDELIDEAINLGFIDVNEETTVTVHGSSNAIRDRIQNRINSAFLERGIMGKAQGKPDTDLIEEAEALGVEVGFLRLVYRALEADDTLSFEDALLMTQEALIAIIRDNAPNLNMVMNAMKTEFFEDRQALFDVYIPQIQALEAQIALLEEAEEDSTDLRAELDALKQEFLEALAQLRSAYQADKEAQRAMFFLQRQERVNTHQNEVAAFRNAMRTRRMQMKSAIEAFQRGTRTTLQSGNQGS